VKLIVFDFDGLILDTEVPVYDAWQEIYGDHGHELAFEKWAQCIGTADTFDPCVDLATLVGRALDSEALRRRHRTRTDVLIAAQPVRPGIRERLEEAAGLGLALGVASSSDRTWVHGHLARLGLLDRFQAICCAEDVPRVKPDPALYRAVLQAFHVAPAEALALEDSPNGVLAAKRAGLACVAVPNPLTARLDLGHADLVLGSLADVSLTELIGLATARASRRPVHRDEGPPTGTTGR
jgi:HAD superfamily hydrolase (TIGR01509 family)